MLETRNNLQIKYVCFTQSNLRMISPDKAKRKVSQTADCWKPWQLSLPLHPLAVVEQLLQIHLC